MKFVLLLLTLLILQTIEISAQNFAPVGAEWYYTERSVYNDDVSYSFISSVKDTLFESRQCRMLQNVGHICAWHPNFVYDSNDSVFYWHPDREEFCLLFDFGAQIGDIWKVYHLGFNDSTLVRVDSIDMEIIDNEPLRVLYTTNLNQMEGGQWTFEGKFVERIGGSYLFPIHGFCDPPMYLDGLRCYEDSVISVHLGPYECDEIVLSINRNQEVGLDVYPNPTNGIVSIELVGAYNDILLELYDGLGRRRKAEYILNPSDRVSFDIADLESGTYILLMKNNFNIIVTKILLIQ